MERSVDRRKLLQIAAGGIVAIAVGSLAPWATFLGFTLAGTDGDGLYTLAFGAMAGLALWRAWTSNASGMLTGCAALAGIVLAIGVYDYQHIARGPSPDDLGSGDDLASTLAEGLASTVSVGWGLYLLILGAVATAGAALMAWRLQTVDEKTRRTGPLDDQPHHER